MTAELSQMTALSAAPVWEQQRKFFMAEGVRVWRDGIVPSYISTNPFLGGFLAEVLVAYVADVGAPIDVIELGGGSGRLAFHVLRQLTAQLGQDGVPVRYVLTDLAPTMLDYWRQHDRLRPFVDAGMLDFALFDVTGPAPLHLTESGDVLLSEPSERPVAVVASYCFDSVPQDLFSVDEHGDVSECVVRAEASAAGGHDGWPQDVALSFEYRPCREPYYADRELDAVLSSYRTLGRAAMVPFPNTALNSLAFLADRCRRGLLALVGDRGFTHPDHAGAWSMVEPTRHGSVSLPVNFHAIGEWFVRRGGVAWHPNHQARSFNVSAFALSPAGRLARTEAAYRVAAETRDPDTFFTLKKLVQARYGELSVPEAIAFLRLSHWDADIFDGMYFHVLQRLGDDPVDDVGRGDLVRAIGHIWDAYYPVRDGDLAFQAGSVLYTAGAYRDALEFFGRSRASAGESVDVWLNSAVCHHMLDDTDRALACVGRALELSPGLEQAMTLLQVLLADE